MTDSEQIRGTVVATHVWPPDVDRPVAQDLELDWGGAVGDRHHGVTMLSDTRQTSLYPRGTQIRNNRQVTLVDEAELAAIALAMGLPSLAPGLIADNICTRGIPDLTSLAPTTRLVFDSGAVISVHAENLPCTIAGAMVGSAHGTPAQGFPKAAMGLRGVTGWVERPGIIRPGDSVEVVPPRRGF